MIEKKKLDDVLSQLDAEVAAAGEDRAAKLKTEQEKAMGSAQTAWKEFKAASGKSYFYNADTKQTTWEMPEEMKSSATATTTPAAAAPV